MMVVWYNIAIASLLGNVGQEVINIKQQDKITALLCRLSREDELVGDSESIQTQKKMLYQYAKENHFTNIVYYVDDGYSGTTFDRPEFQRLKNDIEKGKVGVVIVKDLSRLGRDHAMIKNEEYLGHLVCNKASTSSYKSKKLLPVDKDKWIIKKNTHEAIIDEETFKRANEIFYRIKKRPKKDGKRSMFSGLLRCDVCGKALSLYSSDKKWDSFCCVTYRSFGKSYCSAHYIRYENLYDFVLNDIRKQIKLALSDKEAFIKSIMINTNQN